MSARRGLDLFRLDGRTALVTGGGGHLGATIATGLADAGATVAVLEHPRREQAGRAVLASLARAGGEQGGRARLVLADARDRGSVGQAVEVLRDAWSHIDVLVNCVGAAAPGDAIDVDLDAWRRALAANLTATFLCCQTVGRGMLERGSGSIVNLASVGGLVAWPGAVAYQAAKAGVVQLTRTLAIEWAPRGVRVNALAPCIFETPELASRLERDSAWFAEQADRIPLGRFGRPSELVGPTLFLASDAASMVTGAILPVDGGYTAC